MVIKDGKIQVEDKWLTIKNYKEPLKKIPKKDGHGFFGTLLCSVDGELVQCHICGKLLKSLPGHIWQKHNMKMKKYRSTFGLSSSTALVSENERLRMRNLQIKLFASLTQEEKQRLFEAGKKANLNRKGEFHPKESLENKNKKGTCPDQLLETIKTCAKSIGHTPTKKEFIDFHGSQRFVHLIYKTFGSWTNALKMTKLQPTEYKKGVHRRYNDDELLEYLKIFAEENDRLPTATDFRRDYLPKYDVYLRRFGSIKNARTLAGLAQRFPAPSRWHLTPNQN